jgi:hypothetical protein
MQKFLLLNKVISDRYRFKYIIQERPIIYQWWHDHEVLFYTNQWEKKSGRNKKKKIKLHNSTWHFIKPNLSFKVLQKKKKDHRHLLTM